MDQKEPMILMVKDGEFPGVSHTFFVVASNKLDFPTKF